MRAASLSTPFEKTLGWIKNAFHSVSRSPHLSSRESDLDEKTSFHHSRLAQKNEHRNLRRAWLAMESPHIDPDHRLKWLSDLEKVHGKSYVDDFLSYNAYQTTLDKIHEGRVLFWEDFVTSLEKADWKENTDTVRLVNEEFDIPPSEDYPLEVVCPSLYIGQYGGRPLGLRLGSACLDYPGADSETSDLYGIKGLRYITPCQNSSPQSFLFVTLGNLVVVGVGLYDYFDTGLVVLLEIKDSGKSGRLYVLDCIAAWYRLPNSQINRPQAWTLAELSPHGIRLKPFMSSPQPGPIIDPVPVSYLTPEIVETEINEEQRWPPIAKFAPTSESLHEAQAAQQ